MILRIYQYKYPHDELTAKRYFRILVLMKKRGKELQRFKVAVVAKRINIAGRERVSGILRYFSSRPEYEIRLFQPTDDCGDWVPDGVIGTSPATGFKPQIPHVIIDKSLDSDGMKCRIVSQVTINDTEIGRLVARLLISRGFTHFTSIATTNPIDRINSEKRESSFRKAIAANDDCHYHPVSPVDQSSNLDAEALYRLRDDLLRLPKPCGVFVYNDQLAKEVIDACRLGHLRIPEQLAIIGVDNDPDFCESSQPPLSSVAPDFFRAGVMAATTLDHYLKDGTAPSANALSYGVRTVVERASTLSISGAGRLVVKSCDFIADHAETGIRVPQVVANAKVSRRTLENHFREILGHGIAEEIRRVRFERVCRLLQTTDLSATEIGYRLGFDTPSNFKTAFRKRFGATPSEWRKGDSLTRANADT